MNSTAPLLDLDALAPTRPTVNIKSAAHPEGKLYEIRVAEDLGIEMQTDLANRGERLEQLVASMGDRLPTVEEGRDLALLMDKMVPAILPDIEEEVMAALNDQKKLAIIRVFTEVSAMPEAPLETTTAPQTPTATPPAPPTSEN